MEVKWHTIQMQGQETFDDCEGRCKVMSADHWETYAAVALVQKSGGAERAWQRARRRTNCTVCALQRPPITAKDHRAAARRSFRLKPVQKQHRMGGCNTCVLCVGSSPCDVVLLATPLGMQTRRRNIYKSSLNE